MSPSRLIRKCRANKLVCPRCGYPHHANFSSAHRKVRGRGVEGCAHCKTEFFWHAADGGAEVVELRPGEAASLNIDDPLPTIWLRLGLLVTA